jgi:hypothetical protein
LQIQNCHCSANLFDDEASIQTRTARTLSGLASAQSYPTRPVHIVVGFAAGGAPDILARLLGQWLSERLGQTIDFINLVLPFKPHLAVLAR